MKINYSKKDIFKSQRKRKISFCMTCMNRLHHVKRTLPDSIVSNQSYKNIEFVLLNYNSQDGLDEWIKKYMMKHIESRVLNYYKMIDPKPRYFNMTHAKNIAHKLGDGEILCNLDADNVADRSNTDYIIDIFKYNANNDIFLSPCWQETYHGIMGRICLRQNKFYILQGYNEIWEHYGSEDMDIVKRLRLSGSKRQCFNPEPPLRCIMHSDTERLNLSPFNGLDETDTASIWNKGAPVFRRYRKKYGFKANEGKQWGKANIIKNFTETIST